MSREIDERIVEMRFDNSNFERNVSQSMSTIEKLKSSLNFKGAADGLDEINKATGRIDFSGFQNGVETVQAKFSMLEVVAISALNNIVNKAVDAGLSLTKSLTIDQVTAGYSKFNDKVQSTATIMSATGKSVEEVESQLQKLNWFTDETSASFTDMTSNIGKFTNAGVPLETAVTAMQGISTWGYKSGATINEMGRAMYNLSQAMAVGSVKLMDWKSIENANMATTEFKQTAIDTAVALGTLTKEVDENGQTFYKTLQGNTVTVTNFNAALSDAWFTSDVLTGALNNYGSFAAQLQEACEETGTYATEFIGYYQDYVDSISTDSEKAAKVVADFAEETNTSVERATEIFESLGYNSAYVDELAKSMVEASAKTNKLELSTEELEAKTNDLSDALEKAFFDNKKGVLDMGKAMKETGLTADELNDAFSKIEKNTNDLGFAAFKASQEAKTLQEAIDATKDAVSTSWMNIFQTIFGNYEEAKEVWTKLSEDLYEIFVDPLNDFMHTMQEWSGKDLGGRQTLIDSLSASMDNLKEVIAAVSEGFAEIFPPKTAEDIQKMVLKFERFTKAISLNSDELEQLKTGAKGVAAFLHAIGTVLKRVISLIIPTNSQIMSTKSGILSVIETIGNVLIKIDEWVQNNNKLFGSLKDLRTTLNNKFADLHVLESVSNLFDKIGEKVKKVKDIFKDVDFSFKGIGTSIKNAVTGIWNTLKDAFKNFSLPDLFKNIDFGKIAKGAGFAGIILVINKLANAIKKFNPLKKITDSLSDTFDKLGDTLSSLKDKLTGGKLADFDKFVKPMLKFAIAIGILAVSFKVLGSMNWDQIKQATVSLTAIVVELGGALVLISKFAGKSTAKKILQFSIAVAILTACFKSLGEMTNPQIEDAVVAFSVIIVELTGALLLLSNFSGVFKPAKVIQFALAVAILTACFKSLGEMYNEQIEDAVVAFSIIVAELTGALLLLSNFSGVFKPKKVIQFALAIAILTACFKSLGEMTNEEVKNGAKGLSLIIAELVAAFVILGNFSGIFSPAKVLQITASIAALTACFVVLSKIPKDQASVAASALNLIVNKIVSAFVILGNFSGIFAPAKVVQVTACVATLTACFVSLSKIPADACKTAADAFKLITGKVVEVFTTLGQKSGIFAPRKVTQVTICIKTLSDCFVELSSIDAASEKTAAEAFNLITGKVVEVFTTLGQKSGIFAPKKVGQVTASIATLTNSFVKLAGLDSLMVDSAIKSIELNVPKIISIVMTLSDAKKTSQDAVTVGNHFYQFASKIMAIDISIRDHASAFKTAIFSLNTINTSNLESVGASIKNFAQYILSINASAFNSIVKSFGNLGTNISKTIATNMEQYNIETPVSNVVTRMVTGFNNSVFQFESAGSKCSTGLMNAFNRGSYQNSGAQAGAGFAAGARSMQNACYSAGASLALATNAGYRNYLRIKSPSRVAMESAKYFGIGIVEGIKQSEKLVYNAGSDLGIETNKGFDNAIAKIKDAINTDIDYNPTITPVLDLSQIQNGSNLIKSMFGTTSVGMSRSIGMSSAISRTMNDKIVSAEKQTGITNDDHTVTNNTFNINGSDSNPREIAQEISKILNKQYERRSAAWA